MKKFLYALVIFLTTYTTHSQITGRVVDQDGEPLPGAAVALYGDGDALEDGTTSEPDGRFRLEAPPGRYRLNITFIAFESIDESIAVPAGGKLDLGSFRMQEAQNTLDEVEVQGMAKMMEFKQDKRVFNVTKDLTSTGTNASDLLQNIPSVDVDIEGNVSLRGSQNVRILVNGKPSGLIGNDPAAALRQLQTSMIERVEVITNPGARYEAEGEGGIINIVLKKEERPGINGTFEGNTGYYDNHGVSAGINYRTGNFNWFVNGNYNYRRAPGGGFTEQIYKGPDTSATSLIEREHWRGRNSGTIRFGTDINLTPTQTLTSAFLYRKSLGDNISTLRYLDYDQNDNLLSEVLREDAETEDGRTMEADLHWEKNYDEKDHKWTADLNFQDDRDFEASNVLQDTLESRNGNTGELLQKVKNLEYERNLTLQTDYVRPFNKHRRYEVGARAGIRNIENNYSVEETAPGGEFIELPAFTNEFQYLENIYAVYGIYSDAFGADKQYTYQLGLRSELTDIAINDDQGENLDKEYLNFFPSAFFTWKINPLHDLQINYSRRISRPHFRWLLPFSNYTDPRNFWRGNPDLDPTFTDSYEAGFMRYWEKASLYSGIYYRHQTGTMERIRFLDSVNNGVPYTSIYPINLGIQDAYGFEFNLSYDVTAWYSTNANINLFAAITTGQYEGIDYGNRNFTSQSRWMNRLKFWKSDLQISLNYRGPQTTPQGRSLAITSLDIAWSKDILKGNGTITASVRDLFNSRKRRSFAYGPDWETYGEFQWRRRQFLLTFTYRLNRQKERGQPGEGGSEFDGGDF